MHGGSAKSLLVGVDAGGSHTEAAVADESLVILARARGGPGAVGPRRIERPAQAIAATVREALRQARRPGLPATLVVGAAGAGRDPERQALFRALRAADLGQLIEVTTDAAIALESVFHGSSGILLNAGSGSVAYARDASGVLWRVGGLGWQLGDEGSGYSLGRAALGAAGRAADGRGPETALFRALARQVGADALDALVRWAQEAGPGAVAALARTVQDVAHAGDEVAELLVRAAAEDLARLAMALLPRFPGVQPVPLALSGGMLTQGRPVRQALLAGLSESAPRLVPVAQTVDAPRGALLMAAQLLRATEL